MFVQRYSNTQAIEVHSQYSNTYKILEYPNFDPFRKFIPAFDRLLSIFYVESTYIRSSSK